jgi:hypothetical protein
VAGDQGAQPPVGGGFTALVRSVSVFEHADLLNDALSTAKTRVLIIAPRVKKSVVNTDFLAKLERGLRAGVEVTIAHGYGDDRGSDEQALKRLGNLASRFPRFTFVRDSGRTCRMEEGTLVNIPARVNKEYQR